MFAFSAFVYARVLPPRCARLIPRATERPQRHKARKPATHLLPSGRPRPQSPSAGAGEGRSRTRGDCLGVSRLRGAGLSPVLFQSLSHRQHRRYVCLALDKINFLGGCAELLRQRQVQSQSFPRSQTVGLPYAEGIQQPFREFNSHRPVCPRFTAGRAVIAIKECSRGQHNAKEDTLDGGLSNWVS